MNIHPDFDPLDTLEQLVNATNTHAKLAERQSKFTLDLLRNQNQQAMNINDIVTLVNGLNSRICILENQLNELQLKYENNDIQP